MPELLPFKQAKQTTQVRRGGVRPESGTTSLETGGRSQIAHDHRLGIVPGELGSDEYRELLASLDEAEQEIDAGREVSAEGLRQKLATWAGK